MNKRQRLIIAIGFVLILLSVLCPPYYRVVQTYLGQKSIYQSGWTFIFNIKVIAGSGRVSIRNEIRFDILFLAIFIIVILTSFAIFLSKKQSR